MKNSPYNTAPALATRIAVILQARPHLRRTERVLTAIDVLTTHARQFGLYPANLHGDSLYGTIEFAARCHHIHAGIRYAVTHGLITPTIEADGIRYAISETGRTFVARLSSQYLSDYTRALNPVLAYVDSRPEYNIIDRIEQHGIETIKEDRP